MTVQTDILMTSFAADVCQGLSANQKRLFSKYFYDDEGSRIFQEIMKMPEYYPTNAELEIMTTQARSIYETLNFKSGFNIVELGAGDGMKTKSFLAELTNIGADFRYLPLDISKEAMKILKADLVETLPGINIQPLVGDYFQVLDQFDLGDRPNLFMFLGGNIGNYENDEAVELLRHFGAYMKAGDQMLVGFDLKKNPNTIRLAYDDPKGITRRFNLNLLQRINRELGANFELDNFDFYSTYNPENGDVRSYLVSLQQQEVFIETLEKTFSFEKDELIFTELSKKYSKSEIDEIAYSSGFVGKQHFMDSEKLFSDSLWIKSDSKK